MPVSSLHIIRNATMYIKHSTVLHLATDLNLKFVYFIYSFYLLTVQCVIENTATKKTHEKVSKKVSKIHNNKCHRKPHYSSINLSQKYNTNVQFVCEWHWLRTFVFLQFHHRTMVWPSDKIMTFHWFLNCKIDFHLFHFILMKEMIIILIVQSYKGKKSICSLLYILYQNHIVNW